MSKNTKSKNKKEDALKAALAFTAKKGWQALNIKDFPAFDDKADILSALGEMIDCRVLDNTNTADEDIPHRDRLFDIMMERFDVLNEHRQAIISILQDMRCAPKDSLTTLPHIFRSMGKMLDAAKIDTSGLHGCAKIIGLTTLYIKTLWVWMDDESKDMAKTMAELDKNLGYAEKAVTGLRI